jgi:hypothetical protein
MKAYKVQIKSHYVESKVKVINADSEFSARMKARKVFGFNGSDRHIKIISA